MVETIVETKTGIRKRSQLNAKMTSRYECTHQAELIEREDLIINIIHTLFDVGELHVHGIPKEILQVTSADKVIPGCFENCYLLH